MTEAPQRGTYEVRGMNLAYHTWGDPNSPAVLAVHGFMDHGRAYAPTVELLTKNLYVVAPDLRGHGQSDWVGAGGYYHFYDYFDDVRRLLDHLAIDRLAIIGHSMGGSVATGTAAMLADRVRRVVLLEGMGPPFSDAADTVERLRTWSQSLGWDRVDGDRDARRAQRRKMTDVEDAASRLCRTNPRLAIERARVLASTFTEPSADGDGVVWCCDPLHRTPAAKPFMEDEAKAFWKALTMPVLSLYGEHGWPPDRLEERHATVPNLTIGRVRGAGHNIHHDRPDVVAAVVDTFIGDEVVAAWSDVDPIT